MKKLVAIIVLLVMTLLVPVSCARAPQEKLTVPTTPTPAPMSPRGEVYVDTSQAGGANALAAATEERMIVRTGSISLVVKDIRVALDNTAGLALGRGGYVVSSWMGGEGEGLRGNISIRVPDDQFESAIVELRKLAVRVDSESTNSQDVTEEYTDLEARLTNAEATEKQYRALLDKATTVEDMLKIYDSLSRVRQEIEQIKGRMQYLERTSSMSLITVSLSPLVSAEPLVSVGWSALEILKSAVRGIVTFGQWLVSILIWVVIFIPIWGTILGILYWRLRRRKRA